MSQSQFDHTPHTEWYIPTISEFDSVRKQAGISKKEMSEIMNYGTRNGYHTVLYNGFISIDRLQTGVEYLVENEIVDWYLPDVEEIAAEIDRLGIRKTHFAESVGYESGNSFHHAISNERISYDKYRRCPIVIEFQQEHGYLPLPWEIE